MNLSKTSTRLTALALSAALLGGCSALDRFADIGSPPDLTPVKSPTAQPNYQPVSFPMPAPVAPQQTASFSRISRQPCWAVFSAISPS